jgi:uncharacterized protein involved in response to NO
MIEEIDQVRRRVRIAVWGLASSLALFASSFGTWAGDSVDHYTLWELASRKDFPDAGRITMWVIVGTLLLALVATAEASPKLALATGLAACVAAFFEMRLRNWTSGPALDIGSILTVALAVVFFGIAYVTSVQPRSAAL